MTVTFVPTLITAEIEMADRRRWTTGAETTPVAGLAIVPAFHTTRDDPAEADYTGGWSVLHLASGKTVTSPVPDVAQARELARRLGTVPIDWTATGQAIKAAAAADTGLVVAVHEAWLDAYAFGADSIEKGGDDDDGC